MRSQGTTIYVLSCRSGKYYIGKTNRPITKRIEEHMTHEGSEWTAMYTPIKVVDIKYNADDFDEDKYTKMYMKKYGIDNVRGGSYTQVCLPDHTKQHLMKELCTASDVCFRCHRPGHFANNCYARTRADGSYIHDDDDDDEDSSDEEVFWCCQYCDKEFDTEAKVVRHEKVCRPPRNQLTLQQQKGCYRCGRTGHYASSCYGFRCNLLFHTLFLLLYTTAHYLILHHQHYRYHTTTSSLS